MKKSILLILSVLLLACSCSQKADPEFLQTNDFCLRIKDNVIFNYNENTCQSAFNRKKCEFRVHTDSMSDYYCVTLNGVPVSEGEKLSGDIVWTSTSSVLSKRGCNFVVSKLDAQRRVWLWSRKEQIGVVVQILD